ncbi:MAG: di-heme oxidoredictase family protein [Cyclobacteriaceae bacterium]
MRIPIILLLTLSLFWYGCEEFLPDAPAENEVLDGPIDGLTMEQQRIFAAGDEAFNELFTPLTGLGPIFVAQSCGSCHAGDGKGHPSTTLTRFGRFENGIFDHLLSQGGPQLQNRAIPGFTLEVLPVEATGVTELVAPSVTGLGLLAAVPDQTLLDLVEKQKKLGLVSGEVSLIDPPDFFVPQPFHIANPQGQYIGRFGKKAGAIDLLHQTVSAYKQDMGITSEFDPVDPINFSVSASNTDAVEDPEVFTSTINSLVFYLRTLKPPLPRDDQQPAVLSGKDTFTAIGCGNCHLPEMETGPSDLEIFANKKFHPYTDLLLHDMGSELDDGYVDGSELSPEWRTPPLWGLGLAADAQGGEVFLLHDGRAKSIEAAIEFHGGEASLSREQYGSLSDREREDLIQFLESL